MEKQKINRQSGFVIIPIILGVVLLCLAGAFVFLRINEASSSMDTTDTKKSVDQAKLEADSLLDKDETKEVANAASPGFAAAPAADADASEPDHVSVPPTTSPSVSAPDPVVVAESNATPFTAANCAGSVTVYVSNKNGAEASYSPPGSWRVVNTYSYGQALEALCIIGDTNLAPDYVLVDDAYIKSTDVSPTQP